VQVRKKDKSYESSSESQASGKKINKKTKEIIVQKKLEMGPGLKLCPSNSEEKYLVEQALKDKNKLRLRQPSSRRLLKNLIA